MVAPRIIKEKFTSNQINITWKIDEYNNNRCKRTKLYVICESVSNNNCANNLVSSDTIIEDNSNSLISTTDGLSAFTTYICYGVIENIAGNSSESEALKFTTNSIGKN